MLLIILSRILLDRVPVMILRLILRFKCGLLRLVKYLNWMVSLRLLVMISMVAWGTVRLVVRVVRRCRR